LKLLIVHYHLRPGGIRRIIESATPFLLAHFGRRIDEAVLATGEANDRPWNSAFARSIKPVPLRLELSPAFNYVSEQNITPALLREEVRQTLSRLLCGSDHWLVWSHNPGIGRNLILTDELVRACARANITLLFHHHDWWFDNRWERWPEIRRLGFRTRRRIAAAVFPAMRNVSHVAINKRDAALLRPAFPKKTFWLPNLTERRLPSTETLNSARQWIEKRLGVRDNPLWILPCRLLRRKNVAEAILLTRWLQPAAWLITTGGVSSAQEAAYASRLNSAIRENHWQVALGVLDRNELGQPNVETLIQASEAVLLTSIQEGFGLAYLEAVAAARPLIARTIPHIVTDLRSLGFAFPQSYAEILIGRSLFDHGAERRRQELLFQQWRHRLPKAFHSLLKAPHWLENENVPFSRLTLTAQIEVLTQPVERSWKICQTLNPFLHKWTQEISKDCLQTSAWPSSANDFLSGPSYAKRLAAIFSSNNVVRKPAGNAKIVQDRFIRQRLQMSNLFPLLWAEAT
jgi:glycosyltransferase involved in cell wall biosynthesis